MKSKLAGAALCVAILMPAAAQANDYPTASRMEYVLECMKDHNGKYEYLYKCSCAIDRIADQIGYDEYVEISTATHNQNLGGERGAEFRDPPMVRDMIKKYKAVQHQANEACFVQ